MFKSSCTKDKTLNYGKQNYLVAWLIGSPVTGEEYRKLQVSKRKLQTPTNKNYSKF